MDVLARKSLPERVRHAQAWAERQLSRASQLIRSSSVASTPSLREIRNQSGYILSLRISRYVYTCFSSHI
uniref:Uncharacterized protein n=1 Tax=Ascaris lumbricoides TaxID=6252 RepID=A0A0M3HX96_ASCLU